MSTNNSKKRILYVENGIGYGGAIICLRHLVRNLDSSRFTSLVVTGRTGVQYQEIKHESQWKHIPDRRIDIVGLRKAVDQIKGVANFPGLKFFLNQLLSRMDDLINFLPFFFMLLWTAWRFKADLIHANNEPLCNRAALLVGKCLAIPIVCHVRGDQEGSRLMGWAYSLPNCFIPVSHWVAESIEKKLKVDRNKINVIYDGIALDQLNINAQGLNFRAPFRIEVNDFAVGLVGLLIPWKGQEMFIDSAKLLKNKIPHLKMIIVGGTPDDCTDYEKMLRERVLNEELDDIIIFTGHIKEMAHVYNGLDIIVSASTSPEPLGTVVIESLAMGRPLIGPNHGGAAEMMKHGHTGLLFEPKNPSSLASAIESLYKDEALRIRLGHNARQHALETFSVDIHSEKVQKIYDELLNEQTQ
jgi:glycosyltransferase involved in cell wall biosynthesis